MASLEGWKDRLDLMDEDILTPEYLNRVAAQLPAQESEIVYCACGCGEFWLRPVGEEGRKRRHVRGHAPRGKPMKTRAELIAESIESMNLPDELPSFYCPDEEGS